MNVTAYPTYSLGKRNLHPLSDTISLTRGTQAEQTTLPSNESSLPRATINAPLRYNKTVLEITKYIGRFLVQKLAKTFPAFYMICKFIFMRQKNRVLDLKVYSSRFILML
jgi:hypothetical protein